MSFHTKHELNLCDLFELLSPTQSFQVNNVQGFFGVTLGTKTEKLINRITYPNVLMKPLTVPSAYRDTMSPICKKLDAESDILADVRMLEPRTLQNSS